MHPVLLHRIGDRLSSAEMTACRLDGVLREAGEGYLPADVPDTAEARALGLSPLLPAQAAAAGPSAAWVHGAGELPPPRHHVRPVTARRMREPADGRVRLHEAPLRPGEFVLFGTVAVTTVPVTLIDLARGRPEETGPWLHRLLVGRPEAALEAAQRLAERSRLPGKRAAIDALQRAYDEVTRYTS